MFSESWYAPFWADKWNNKKLVTQEGAYFISVGDCTPTEKDLLLLTACRSGSLLDWDKIQMFTVKIHKVTENEKNDGICTRCWKKEKSYI